MTDSNFVQESFVTGINARLYIEPSSLRIRGRECLSKDDKSIKGEMRRRRGDGDLETAATEPPERLIWHWLGYCRCRAG